MWSNGGWMHLVHFIRTWGAKQVVLWHWYQVGSIQSPRTKAQHQEFNKKWVGGLHDVMPQILLTRIFLQEVMRTFLLLLGRTTKVLYCCSIMDEHIVVSKLVISTFATFSLQISYHLEIWGQILSNKWDFGWLFYQDTARFTVQAFLWLNHECEARIWTFTNVSKQDTTFRITGVCGTVTYL